MPGIRNVISTMGPNGEEMLGPELLLWHYPDSSIVNGSLLTVESNHFCVLKSRGAILNVYETGQYTVQTPDRPLFGLQRRLLHPRGDARERVAAGAAHAVQGTWGDYR